MTDRVALLARIMAAVLGFLLTLFASVLLSSMLINWASGTYSPDIGNPSTDPHGRGSTDAAAVFPIGILISVLLAVVGGWLGWLISSRRNWNADLLIGAPLFLVFSGICLANYTSLDIVFTRDAQAALNIPFAISGIAVFSTLQRTIPTSSSVLLTASGAVILAFCLYTFVAIPLWYSLSYLSWRQGAGELDSLDTAAKAVGAMGSLLAVVGMQWKNGRLSTITPDR